MTNIVFNSTKSDVSSYTSTGLKVVCTVIALFAILIVVAI